MPKQRKKRKDSRPLFNHKEVAILHSIGKSRRYLSVNEISSITGISWTTCNKYIEIMYKDGILSKKFPKKTGGYVIGQKKAKYRVNFEKLYKDPNY